MRISDWSSDVCSSDLEACGATGSATTSAIAGTYRPRPGKTKVKVKSAARQAWSRFTLHACSRASARHGSPPAIRNRAQPAKRAQPTQIVALAHVYNRSRRSAERRSEEHTSELQSLMRISYAVFCLKK